MVKTLAGGTFFLLLLAAILMSMALPHPPLPPIEVPMNSQPSNLFTPSDPQAVLQQAFAGQLALANQVATAEGLTQVAENDLFLATLQQEANGCRFRIQLKNFIGANTLWDNLFPGGCFSPEATNYLADLAKAWQKHAKSISNGLDDASRDWLVRQVDAFAEQLIKLFG